MPDDPQPSNGQPDQDLPDQQKERIDALFSALGVPQWFYTVVLQAAVNFTVGAPADPNPSPWISWGARNIGGRVRALAQNPVNPSILYAGTGFGGVFKSTDDGDTWRPMGRPQDAFSVGALAVAPSNPNRLYVGTGEPVVRHAAATLVPNPLYPAGLGFFRYDENAAPPQFVNEVGPPPVPVPPAPAVAGPAGSAHNYAKIVVDPHNPERCWIASDTGLWRRERPNLAAPPTFTREPVIAPAPAFGAFGSVATDVLVVENWDPQHPAIYRIYAAMGGNGIYRGTFDTSVAGANTAWEPNPLRGGLPGASVPGGLNMDRIRLAYCRSRPLHIYAVMENPGLNRLFHSTDGGNSWTSLVAPPLELPPPRNSLWWSLVIEVHPENPGLVVCGGVDLFRSRDFGVTWEPIISWSNFEDSDRAQHGDEHAALFDAGDPNRFWAGNDGGVSMTPDIVLGNPHTDRSWRKRSDGLVAAQFNDVSINPNFPFMMGGGLQDNGTYVTFGGPSWHTVGGADGGYMGFEVNNPRTFVSPLQNAIRNGTIVSPTTPGRYSAVLRSQVNADQPPPNDLFSVSWTAQALAGGLIPDFIPVIEHHPVTPGHFLVGCVGGAVVVNAGVGAVIAPPAPLAGQTVGALAYGSVGAAPNADWWLGTSGGIVLRGTNAAPNTPAWARVVGPAIGAAPAVGPPAAFGAYVSRIVVHPANNNYVVFSTAGNGSGSLAGSQGRVFLSLDRGATWNDITGLAAVNAPPGAAPALQSLPPGAVSSLAFNPTVALGSPQELYAGTMAGVYVIRNLPPANLAGAAAAAAAIPGFNPRWFSFNMPAAPGQLPLVLVQDVVCQTIPPTPAAVAGTPESRARQRLICATFGRGIYTADITAPNPPLAPLGGPRFHLYIRQYLIEDGLGYPRVGQATLNAAAIGMTAAGPQLGGDPRFPAGTVQFRDVNAFDIRVDNAPFQYFDETLDGAEFDQDLSTKSLVPGDLNVIYVQVHTSGWDAIPSVDVHLYFAPVAAAAAGVAQPAPQPDLQANFWANFTADPLPAGTWQRAGKKQTLTTVAPNDPAVARFEWVPPDTLAGGSVALLAVCTTAAAADPVPAAPPTVLPALVSQERHVAYRLVPTTAFTPDVYIRHGIEDDGTLGSIAFTGRSPDIIVVPSIPAQAPELEFKDLASPRVADRIKAGQDNFVYVRVFNRKRVPVDATVTLFWVKPNISSTAADASAPPFDQTKWGAVNPVGTAHVLVPDRGWALLQLKWTPPAADPVLNSVGLIALIKSTTGTDIQPVQTRIRDVASFWQFFRTLADSNNATLRAIAYG